MNLGENIYRLRTQHNMSQGDLADALNVSRQSVSKWENNSAVPELEKLMKMAQLFGITLDELVGNTSEPAPAQSPEQPVQQSSALGHKAVGLVLLICGFIVFVAYSVIGYFSGEELLGLIMALPFVLCGIVCLVCKYNPGYWCALVCYWVLWLTVGILAQKAYGSTAAMVTLALIICGAILLLWTLKRFRSEKLRIPKFGKIIIAAALAGSIAVSIVSMLPPRRVELAGEEEPVDVVTVLPD